ncbi:MAG: hypothetical protein WCF23_02465, partial [Candidatus Nitrosopolaris sp.]
MAAAYGIGVKSIEQGTATTVWCAVSPQLNGKGGVYCAGCDIAELISDDSQLRSGVRHWARYIRKNQSYCILNQPALKDNIPVYIISGS